MELKTVHIHKQMRTGSGVIDLGTEERLVPVRPSTRINKEIDEANKKDIIRFKHEYEAAKYLRGEDDE